MKQYWIPIFIVLSIIIVMICLFYDNSSESFKQCVCSSRQGGCAGNCQDIDVVDNAYASGVLTEFSDLKSPGWDRGPNPGSYRFPSSCSGAPYSEHPNFGPWDFSDFANR